MTCVSRMDRVEKTIQSMYRIDLVVLGFDMPSPKGYHVLNMIRADRPEALIIAYTCHTDYVLCLEQDGLKGLIAKPIDTCCFRDTVWLVLMGLTDRSQH